MATLSLTLLGHPEFGASGRRQVQGGELMQPLARILGQVRRRADPSTSRTTADLYASAPSRHIDRGQFNANSHASALPR